jgi:hypothetical protein
MGAFVAMAENASCGLITGDLAMLRHMTAAAVAALTCLAAAPAKANTIPVTYVSGKGADSGTCASPANPCRTFQFAVSQTAPGGEVKALNPAEYGPVRIDKSISITGVEGAGIDTNGGSAIVIATPTGVVLTVHLANLLIQNVSGSGDFGIGGGNPPGPQLTVTHCTVRGY